MSVIGPVVGNFLNFLIQNLRVRMKIDKMVASYDGVKNIIENEISQAKANLSHAKDI